MSLLKEAVNEQAYLKAGILGFPGSGKTFTAAMLAIAIAKQIEGDKPIAFFDTETGSDFLLPQVQAEGLKMLRVKSCTFPDLMQVVKEAEGKCSVLIVDSISHVWRELCETFRKKRNLTRLEFHHWAMIKTQWLNWTLAYLNSPLHIIVCGRAGYDYDFETNEEGKKDLVKVGTKMKVESEFGFEPSLLIEMERAERSAKPGSGWTHRAHVLKDRTDTINGIAFDFHKLEGGYTPGGYMAVLQAFAPVIRCLNLGGAHLGVDASRTSEELFSGNPPDYTWKREQEMKEVALDEITEELKRAFPTQTNEDKKARADLLETVAGTRSWKAVEAMKLNDVLDVRNEIWIKLRGNEYGHKRVGDVGGEDGQRGETGDSSGPNDERPEDPKREVAEQPNQGGGGLDRDGGGTPASKGTPGEDLPEWIEGPSGEPKREPGEIPASIGGEGGVVKSKKSLDFDRIKERARKEKEALDGRVRKDGDV